jgi:hypothetical protein
MSEATAPQSGSDLSRDGYTFDPNGIWASADERAHLLVQLRLLNITEIDAEYSGSDDSGQFEGVSYTGGGENPGSTEILFSEVTFAKNYSSATRTFAVRTVEPPKSMTLDAIFESILCNIIDNEDVDLDNNDGGNAHLVIRVDDGGFEIECKLNEAFTDYNTTEVEGL